ncbi:hypothetical protein [Mycobacterium sherrisii]|nr:hypothetical protein [Mycobacterium sherrisii]MCV7027934.1 hypothetical protein [Mycobacterium sherrisii]
METGGFTLEVQSIVGPVLSGMGFTLDTVDESVDEGGRTGWVVIYRGVDCKIQIYYSSREGEVNAMIGPLDAPNKHGAYDDSGKWRYFSDLETQPIVSLEELVKNLRAERANFETTSTWLEWITKERILRYFDSAHAVVVGRQ